MAKVVIFGTGQWASLAHFYLTHDSPHEVVAFTGDEEYLKDKTFNLKPVVPFQNIQHYYPPEAYELFLPINFQKMNRLRAEKYYYAKQLGYNMISYISSKATIWPDFSCGENCFIFEDNTIQPFVQIGNNVIIWSGNHIGHHTLIKDHVFIASHVVISGGCTIEPYCFLGVNATIRDQTVIREGTLVGAGTLIMSDTQQYEVYIGNATKPVPVRSDQIKQISHKKGG